MTQNNRALLGLLPATCFLTQNIFSFLQNTPGQGSVGKQLCIWCLQHSNVLYSLFFNVCLPLPNLLCNTSLVLANLQGMEMTVHDWWLFKLSPNGWPLAVLICLHAFILTHGTGCYLLWPTWAICKRAFFILTNLITSASDAKRKDFLQVFQKPLPPLLVRMKDPENASVGHWPQTLAVPLNVIHLSSGTREWHLLSTMVAPIEDGQGWCMHWGTLRFCWLRINRSYKTAKYLQTSQSSSCSSCEGGTDWHTVLL